MYDKDSPNDNRIDMVLLNFTHLDVLPVLQPATVTENFSATSRGKVKFQGSYWRAKSLYSEPHHVFQEDQTVAVMGREGLTLLIQPLSTLE